MNKFKYISPLNETQRYELEELRKGSSKTKVRSRAHAILLSSEGFTIEELMEIFKVERDTISRWLNNWEQNGLEGLHDKVRSGRIPTLNKDEQNVLKELIQENPRSSKVVAQKLFNQTGKKLSHWSVKRLAKYFGLSWKRIRKSCKSKCDEKKFRKAKSELAVLERVALTNAKKSPQKKENPITKASESDRKIFKQLIDLDRIIIDEVPNIAKVVKPKNQVVIQTASSTAAVSSKMARFEELSDEGIKPQIKVVATQTASSNILSEVAWHKDAKPKAIATQTASSKEAILSEMARPEELSDEGIKPQNKVVVTQTASSTEAVLSKVAGHEDFPAQGSQVNKNNRLYQLKSEGQTVETKSVPNDENKAPENINCSNKTNKIHDNTAAKIRTEPSKVEIGNATHLNTNKSFNKNIFEVVYFDATGFDLIPSVPYAWQDKGRKNTICVPSKPSKRINVLGFLNKIHQELTPFVFEETITTDVVVKIFDAFSAQIHNPTLVVMDNASIHTSTHFFNQIETWQEKGLFPYFLPTYSPELNAIETLWRKIKYEWLPFSAYESFKKLQEAVDEILIDFGTKYLITFA